MQITFSLSLSSSSLLLLLLLHWGRALSQVHAQLQHEGLLPNWIELITGIEEVQIWIIFSFSRQRNEDRGSSSPSSESVCDSISEPRHFLVVVVVVPEEELINRREKCRSKLISLSSTLTSSSSSPGKLNFETTSTGQLCDYEASLAVPLKAQFTVDEAKVCKLVNKFSLKNYLWFEFNFLACFCFLRLLLLFLDNRPDVSVTFKSV